MKTALSILSVIFGYTLFPLGNVLQKIGVSWQVWKGEKDSKYYKNLSVWCIGLLLSYVIAIAPTGIASKYLPPYVISAVSGWSIAVTIFLTHYLLKEKLFLSDIIYSLLIVGCIFVISIYEKPHEFLNINTTALYLMYFLPFLLPLTGLKIKADGKAKAVLFSSFSGICDGLTIVLLNIMVKKYGTSVPGYLASVYLYMYIAIGISAALSMQMAYKSGDMVVIAPMQISLNIIYPVIASLIMLNVPIHFMQIISVAIIVVSCFMILRKH